MANVDKCTSLLLSVLWNEEWYSDTNVEMIMLYAVALYNLILFAWFVCFCSYILFLFGSSIVVFVFFLNYLFVCIASRNINLGRALRSADTGQLVEPRVHSKYGEAASSRYAAHTWNKTASRSKISPKCTHFLKMIKNNPRTPYMV